MTDDFYVNKEETRNCVSLPENGSHIGMLAHGTLKMVPGERVSRDWAERIFCIQAVMVCNMTTGAPVNQNHKDHHNRFQSKVQSYLRGQTVMSLREKIKRHL